MLSSGKVAMNVELAPTCDLKTAMGFIDFCISSLTSRAVIT